MELNVCVCAPMGTFKSYFLLLFLLYYVLGNAKVWVNLHFLMLLWEQMEENEWQCDIEKYNFTLQNAAGIR